MPFRHLKPEDKCTAWAQRGQRPKPDYKENNNWEQRYFDRIKSGLQSLAKTEQ